MSQDTVKANLTPLQKQQLQLKIIQEINQLIASNKPTEETLRLALETVVKRLDYEAAQIYHLSFSNSELWLYLEVGSGSKPVTQTRDIFSTEEINIISDAARANEVIYLPNILEGPYSYYGQDETDLPVGSEAALPLRYGENLLGVLRLQSKRPEDFSTEEIDFLSSVANLLASVIRNNRTIQRLEDSIQEIKTLYQLQYKGALEDQKPTSAAPPKGYEFNRNMVTETNGLPETVSQFIDHAPEQTRITTPQEGHQNQIMAPIRLHGETIGVLGIEEDSQEETEWSADDIRLLEEVSSQVALAVENSRLLQQTQERTKELSVLFEATRQLSETIDLTEIYEILTSQSINYLKADRCAVLLLNKAKTHFETIIDQIRNEEGQLVTLSSHRSAGIDQFLSLQQLLKQPEIVIQHLDDPALPAKTRQRMEQDNTHTLAQFPLMVRGNLVAIMEVEHFHHHRPYDPNEIQLAQAIISQVTVAIENARLFQQTEAALADTQKLYQISRAFVESTSVDEVFQIVLSNVKAYQIDRVSISLLDRSHRGEIEAVTIVASWDSDPDKMLPLGTSFSTEDFGLVQAFAQAPFHPIISQNLHQPENQDERMDEAFRKFAVESLEAMTLFSAPMFLGAEYKGVLSIYTRQPHQYTQQEIRIYQTLADQAIIAIENYRLLEATRNERDRAALIYELGQTLSYTTTIEEIEATLLDFTPGGPSIRTEIYITDGSSFVSISSSISNRHQETPLTLTELTLQERFEAKALSTQKPIIKNRQETTPDDWPLANLPGLEQIKAVACVPFYSQRSTLQGVLTFFETEDDEGFTKEQIATFESMAIQTAATLENVWLLRQTNLMLDETELLYDITRGFNSAQSAEDLLHVLANNLNEPNTDLMAIALIADSSPAGEPTLLQLDARWVKQTGQVNSTSLKMRADEYSFISQLKRDKLQTIHYHKQDSATQAHLDQHLDGTQSLLFIPLAVGSNWLGVLLLGSNSPQHSFETKTIDQIFNLAGQAAVVLQNLQLVEETQQNLHHSEILSNLGQQLLRAETIVDIYDLTLSAIASTEPDRGAAIFMYDYLEGNVELEMVAHWNSPQHKWPALPLGSRFSTEDLGLVPLLTAGKTVTSTQASQDSRFTPALKQLMTMLQINGVIIAPLWLQQDVGGFIMIGNQTETKFTPDTVRLYEDIARETSGALENRRLFEEAEHRAWQLQTAAEVSQAASSYLDLNTLLAESVDLLKERFNFYHVSIFLLDKYGRYAEVKASTGQIGQKMLAMKHKLEVGGKSIVGTATATGYPKIALDVGQEAVHFDNPLLPETRSEMALPLVVQGRVIGALDVQSIKRNAFSDSDIAVLQSMANQLANAIEAARSIQESKETLAEVSKLHQHYLLDQWHSFLKEQRSIAGYRLDDEGTLVEHEEDLLAHPEINKLTTEKQPIVVRHPPQENNGHQTKKQSKESPAQTEPTNKSTVIAPLTLNDQAVIGAVDFDVATTDVEQELDPDTLSIIQAVTNQAAQAIESARLFEQTQIAREEAEALYQVGRSLVAAENEQEMFNTVLGKLLNTLGLQQGGILFFDEAKSTGQLHALFEKGNPVSKPELEIPVDDNPSYQKLIDTKQPVVIEDVATDPLVATVREMNLRRGLVSLLLAPIIINDEVIGALGADSVGQKHLFTEREISLAIAMADQLSITLQNRRLIEETRRRAVLLQTSSQVGRVASSILDQDKMMEQAVTLIQRRFGFYHVQIFLVDKNERYAVLHTSTGEAGQKLLAEGHKVAIGGQSVIGQVTYRRKTVVVREGDDWTDSDIPRPRNEFLPKTQAELTIPLQVGVTLIGALDLQSPSPTAFTDEEISTLETLAAQIAVSIQNARAYKEQQETAERLKEIDKLKTQFLANMSHELRTPLNSIIGFSRVILKGIDGPLTDLQKADLTSIHNSGQHLLGLINNILDLSKIEAGKMELNFEETGIEPIIKTVTSTALALVKEKPVTLEQELPEELPTIWADPTRIRQVILNLVSNACKFTDEGTVTTRVEVDDNKVTFSVRDTGIGIPQEQIATIFDEFTQVDASTTRKVGGSGLGLPISRHFVELHHGEIWVESTPGRGSTFSFYIPIAPPPADSAAEDPIEAISSEPEKKRLVIAIDDDPGVIKLYQRFLENQHYEVMGIEQGKGAVEQIKTHNPFAILLDVIIPDKDGWSLLKELKEEPLTKNIPVIVCSIVSDKNKGFSLGATDYLTKPIVENELVDALKQLDTLHKEEIKVLVVDDQADDILLIRRILEAQPNYSIIEAKNGKEGLELVKRQEPDLIILDLNMPKMNGFAMIEVLKAKEKTRSIPIIIVSAQELTPEEQQRLTGQVEVLLHKGIFTENELLEDVSRALDRIRQEEKATV